jgi:nicotinamide-nucleotide amidase
MSVCIDEDLCRKAQSVVDKLRGARMSIVTAESCTGGLVAAVLSHGTNASHCLHGGFVVYTKTHKSTALGVDVALLRDRGSVNAEVATQMAEGALRRSQASMAVAVTGVLGPDPDEDGNPPGLVIIGMVRSGHPARTKRHQFGQAHPDVVRKNTVLQALEMVSSEIG